jgi:hypothetical protein
VNKNTTLAVVLIGAAVAWYFYERSRGLTFLGEPINPMVPPDVLPNQQSTIRPVASTGTWATNVFGALSGAFTTILGSLKSGAGAAPRVQSASSTGIGAQDVMRWGLAVPPSEPPPPSVGAGAGTYEDTSYDSELPMWQWLPPTTGVPNMPWTLDPTALGFDPNYIPPPPGS